MSETTWKRWATAIIWIHILAIIGTGCVYGFITFFKPVPFNAIFLYPESAPYYLLTYTFVLLFTFSLCGLGSVLERFLGDKDFRAHLISRGLLVVGILGTVLPLLLITFWDMVLNHPEAKFWVILANMAQHFGIWLIFVITLLYGFVFLGIFFVGKNHPAIPKGWAILALGVGVTMGIVAVSCLWITESVSLFRIIYLICLIGYLVWTLWLAQLINKPSSPQDK